MRLPASKKFGHFNLQSTVSCYTFVRNYDKSNHKIPTQAHFMLKPPLQAAYIALITNLYGYSQKNKSEQDNPMDCYRLFLFCRAGFFAVARIAAVSGTPGKKRRVGR